MTKKEAMRRLEMYKRWGFVNGLNEAISVAVNALKEIQQYREIGTVEECREARERRNPKKVVDICGALGEKYECPECGSSLDDADLFVGNCKWCGQKLCK